MTKKQRREHKQANQRRKAEMLKDKSGRNGVNVYSHLHYGFVQDGKHTKKGNQ